MRVKQEECDLSQSYSHTQTIVANLPYITMVVLGSIILGLGASGPNFGWVPALLYFFYGISGAVWIMVFVCPHCRFHGTRYCPCGYGWIAAKFRERKGEDRFNEKFKRHIPVIVPLWFIPAISGGVMLWKGFSWVTLALVALFVFDSFVVLPLLSKRRCCARCPQKDSCPWMASGKSGGRC